MVEIAEEYIIKIKVQGVADKPISELEKLNTNVKNLVDKVDSHLRLGRSNFRGASSPNLIKSTGATNITPILNLDRLRKSRNLNKALANNILKKKFKEREQLIYSSFSKSNGGNMKKIIESPREKYKKAYDEVIRMLKKEDAYADDVGDGLIMVDGRLMERSSYLVRQKIRFDDLQKKLKKSKPALPEEFTTVSSPKLNPKLNIPRERVNQGMLKKAMDNAVESYGREAYERDIENLEYLKTLSPEAVDIRSVQSIKKRMKQYEANRKAE